MVCTDCLGSSLPIPKLGDSHELLNSSGFLFSLMENADLILLTSQG